MERTNAMLTKTDRQWLEGIEQYDGPNSRQHRYQRRQSIVSGVEQTLKDFSLLVEHWNEDTALAEDLTELFELELVNPGRRSEDEKARVDGLIDLLTFVFLAVTDDLKYRKEWTALQQPNDEPVATGDYQSWQFVWVLQHALEHGYDEFGILMDGITLHMEGQRLPNFEHILSKLEEGESLHPRVAAALIRSGRIDMDRFNDLVREELQEELSTEE